MKLFQKLLLAPAAIGFLSPISASASEANLMDVSNYSQVDVEITQDTFNKPLTTKNPLLAGGEGLGNSVATDFDGDSFSSTTSATFSSNFLLGAVDSTSDEKTQFIFDYGIELATSFTGSDSLDVELEAGHGGGTVLTDADLTDTTSQLKVGSIGYTSTLGENKKLTLYVGAGGSGSALYASACKYEGVTNALDDCGVASTNLDEGFGTAFGASFDLGSGFSMAFGYEGQGMGTEGLMTDEGTDAFGGQIAYIQDNYGIAIAASSIENHNASTNAVLKETSTSTTNGEGVTTTTAISAFFAPDIDRLPSISVGVENTHDDFAAATVDETSHYFIGLQWDNVGEGTLGASLGSKEPYAENADAETMYEIFYRYNYADGISITPVLFVKENAASNVDDETGMLLKTSFSF